MAINDKATVFGSRSLVAAISKLSKNALIDLIWDLAVKDLGEEFATDEAIADRITEWMEPVATQRGDRQINFREIMDKSRSTSGKKS